ncbi:pyruvate dehydrogenase E1 component subunit beta-like protein [Trifolium pratense]|uniref:Pyruvate dehydrogenase E1 component subunit beta-like protein n=1 Tax=Trifolium pratense TaxID=57577 RepID=A0A2K3JRX7_TRIPR|nr:pyruvate dehydrogenase E1 component subunit beta-like protein [Trifolium pratense]PNX56872.1 pyruvate dehydrogenase E1 component subunit beta-like protein [Trifolium pratense]
MATLFQGLAAVTPLSQSNSIESNKLLFSSRRSLSERKGSNFVVRSDAKVNQVLKSGAARKHELLIPNAVATQGSSSVASASKPGLSSLCN